MCLQKHNFCWEDESLEVLMQKYPKCKTALQWWTNTLYKDGKTTQITAYAISRNKYLKDFIIQNPPDFAISNKCCEYSKKQPVKIYHKNEMADLNITGIRKCEGGIRSLNYKSCFDDNETISNYRPLFWYNDNDKLKYESVYGIKHSACYTKYGFKRTGCVGCPYNPNIINDLKIIEKYEPKLYKACINIFGKSYEYTKKYREFVKNMKEAEKKQEKSDLNVVIDKTRTFFSGIPP